MYGSEKVKRICIKPLLLPEVCLRPRNNPLNIGDGPDYGPNLGSGLRLRFECPSAGSLTK